MSQVVNMTNGKCIAHPFFEILKILSTNFFCRSAIQMHCVENLLVLVAFLEGRHTFLPPGGALLPFYLLVIYDTSSIREPLEVS
jgi:hypothetical protein